MTRIEFNGQKASVIYTPMSGHQIVATVHCNGIVNTVYVLRKGSPDTDGFLDSLAGGVRFSSGFRALVFSHAPDGVELMEGI
jgi:hypothetical protein